MTLDFHDAINDDGVFDLQGKAFKAQDTLNTARGTTVLAAALDVLEIFNNLTVDEDLERTIAPLPAQIEAFVASGGFGLMASLQQYCSNLLIELVQDDNPQPVKQLQTALRELIRQMEVESESVDACSVTVSVSANGANNADGVIVLSKKRGDGLIQENLFAESIEVEAIGDGLTAPLSCLGEADVPLLDPRWPAGSGASTSLGAVNATSSLLDNGDMEDEDDVANLPDDWVFSVATIGTTVKMTDVEVQTLVVSGTPSAGHYRLIATNKDGVAQTTIPIVYNATAAAVQAALRSLDGFSSVTVTATGTAPNFSHTITFNSVTGDIPLLRSINNTTGGTLTHAATTQGSSVTEVQTVAISGSPASGTYTLTFTNPSGAQQTTAALAFNADGTAVQAALRLLNGLEAITVSTAGSTPNYTHTITLTGIGGNLSQLTSTNSLGGGSSPTITHATTTQGLQKTFAGGKALELDSDGSQLTAFQQRVTLAAETAYAVSFWAICDVIPAAGVITVDLVDGIGGNVIADKQGVSNSMAFNAASLTKSWKHLSQLVSGEVFFRMPTIIPSVVYFRIRITTAVSNGTSVFLDHAALTRAIELYPGGPLAAAFTGSKPFKREDKWTITTTNDRGGRIQTFYQRNFSMNQLGLLLPSNAAGSETIPDSLAS